MSRAMAAALFKARCLEVLDEVAAGGEPVVVTKRGRPVAQVAPLVRRPATLAGFLRGRVRVTGDIVGSVGEAWDADR